MLLNMKMTKQRSKELGRWQAKKLNAFTFAIRHEDGEVKNPKNRELRKEVAKLKREIVKLKKILRSKNSKSAKPKQTS